MLVGGWGGHNQTQLRKILAYSSIAHLGWIAIVIQYSPNLALLALGMYVVMTSAAFLVLDINRATTINQLAISCTAHPAITVIIPLIFLSLAGLPPFTGFIPK